MANIYMYGIYYIAICLVASQTINGLDDFNSTTYSVCYVKDEISVLSFSCQSDELIIINKAFDGKKSRRNYSFCEKPEPDIKNDCVKFELQRKDNLLSNCDKRSTCRIYLHYKDLLCGDDYRGNNYLAVDYTCYTSLNNGTNSYYHYVYINYDRNDWKLENRALLFTDRYPSWRNVMEAGGACQVFLNRGEYLVVHVLDFAGKLIYTSKGCPIELVLHDGDNWHQLCGNLTWDYKKYIMKPTRSPWRVDIIVSTEIEDSEGRVQILIEGFDSSDHYVENMDMKCGKKLSGLYTVPSTTTTTTTTTTIPTTTTTTIPTTTTTTIPTTTTTTTPTTTERTTTSVQKDVPLLTKTTTNDTPRDSKSIVLGSRTIIIGGLIGGVVLLIIIVVSAVICRKQHTKPNSMPRSDPVMTPNSRRPNGHLGEPNFKKSSGKKQQNQDPKHYNAYIKNNGQNHTSSGDRLNSDEYYDEINDGSLPTHTWMTENRSLAVSSRMDQNPEFIVNHDSAFDEPTETTMKLAKGTTRGFNY